MHHFRILGCPTFVDKAALLSIVSHFTALFVTDITALNMLHSSESLDLVLRVSILQNNSYIKRVGDPKHSSKLIKMITSI